MTKLNKTNKGKSVTFRMTHDLNKKLTDMAIARSVKEGKIIKVSEIIREILEKEVGDA